MSWFPKSSRSLWIVFGALLATLVAWCAADWFMAYPEDAQAEYVGRDRCASCHEVQLRSWTGSHHDRAMELATEEAVLGDFNNAAFTRFGITSRFFRRDGKFFVNTEGPDGEFHDYHVKYTFGIEPLQQYMVEFPDGRVQVLRISWDTQKKKWFYVRPPDVLNERLLPGDPLHWTGVGQNWNTMCAECHSTNLQKSFDLATNTYHTTFSEIDVSCETCHGPGSLHVALAESRSLFWDRRHGYGLAKLKSELATRQSATKQIEACAQCHSRRSPLAPDYHAGEPFLDYYDPSLVQPGLYHADGQILDEVYVYGSFLQSKMYSKGIRCSDCHNPHSLKLKYEGNRLCAQCHQPGKYDSPTHHHHTDPEASLCVSCHMPVRTYMEIDDRHDHSLRIPRPDLSEQLGTPNACNDCHTKPEETPTWAAGAVRKWYGDKRPDDPHYANALSAARQGKPEGFDLLRDLLRRKETPDIIQATAIEFLSGYPGHDADTLCRQFMDASSPMVRAAAVRTISNRSLERFVVEVASRLHDPVRMVRFAAARRLVSDAAKLVDSEFRDALDDAIVEYRQAQELVFDRAGAHMNLAVLSQALGDMPAAIESLETAIRLEPYLSGVRDGLSKMLESTGGSAERIRELREQEIELMIRDSKLLPGNPQPFYKQGMLYYLLGRHDEARGALEEACRLAPNAFDYWLALALICEHQQLWDDALEALKQMQRLRPNDPAIVGIYQRIQQTRAATGEQKPSNAPVPGK